MTDVAHDMSFLVNLVEVSTGPFTLPKIVLMTCYIGVTIYTIYHIKSGKPRVFPLTLMKAYKSSS